MTAEKQIPLESSGAMEDDGLVRSKEDIAMPPFKTLGSLRFGVPGWGRI